MSTPDDNDRVVLRVPVTFGQLRAISRRAGVSGFDGKARTEYLVGCALGSVTASNRKLWVQALSFA